MKPADAAQLDAAREALCDAEHELHRAVAKAFRKGRTEYYTHGHDTRQVTVIDTHDEKVRVRGKGGSIYWVHYFNFIR